MDTLYKTNYTDSNFYYSQVEGETPFKYYKTSHVAKDQHLSTFLAKLQPSNVMNVMGGLEGALLMEAEMKGMSAAVIVGIVDSHYVTAELLQAYGPIINELLEINVDLKGISKHKKFKEVLKEENSRSHNIFN